MSRFTDYWAEHDNVAYWKDAAQLAFLVVAGVWLLHGVARGSVPTIKSATAAA